MHYYYVWEDYANAEGKYAEFHYVVYVYPPYDGRWEIHVTGWVRQTWIVLEADDNRPPIAWKPRFCSRVGWSRLSQCEREDQVGKFIEANIKAKSSKGKATGKASAAEEAKYPALCDYLFSTEYKDGSARETATILFLVDDGRLKACVSDRDSGRVAFLALPSLLEALGALEEALAGDTLDWRTRKDQRKR